MASHTVMSQTCFDVMHLLDSAEHAAKCEKACNWHDNSRVRGYTAAKHTASDMKLIATQSLLATDT